MNEARLRIVDTYLHKGWCSYLDIALAINDAIVSYKGDSLQQFGLMKFEPGKRSYNSSCSFNKQLVDELRSSIGQDFMDIPEIWALANEGRLLSRDGKKSSQDDQEYRSNVRNNLIEEEVRPQYTTGSKRSQVVKDTISKDPRKNSDGEIDIKKVKFYRYKDRNYSLFASGDFKKYQDIKARLKVKNKLASVTNTAVSAVDVKNVLYESDVILEPAVSEKIKQRIRLQNELKEYEDEVKIIIENLQSSITTIGEEKRRGWIKKTINFYKNILELAKSPLSNIDKRQVANHIHDFALFLASENQYQMLGDRFEEAIGIYQRLILIQKHSIDDYLSGEGLFAEEEFDPEDAKQQMQRDKELVAGALLHFARIQFDSHNVDYAESILGKALNMVGEESAVRAKLLQLRTIIYSVSFKMDLAADDIEEAYKCALSSGMEEIELSEIMVSRAELLRAKGETQEAIKVYDEVITICHRYEINKEMLASALMSKAMLHLSPENIAVSDTAITEALAIFNNLYAKEPDRILPSLMSAKYIKMLVASQSGDIQNAVEIGESVISSFSNVNDTLKTLCIQEVVQTLLYMKDMYQTLDQRDKELSIDAKFSEIKNQYRDLINPLLLQ